MGRMATVRASGTFFVLEGNQGLGKTTQARRLEDYLAKTNIPHKAFYFPRYNTFFGKMAADFLQGKFGKLDDISPYFTALIFANDRMFAKPEIKSALADGKLVVGDRWITSNMAIQAAKFTDGAERDEFIAWVEELEYGVFGQVRPDFTIYLRASPEISLRNLRAKGAEQHLEGKADIEESDKSLIQNSFTQYEKLSATLPNWITLDLESEESRNHTGILSPQEVHHRILSLLVEIGVLPKIDCFR